MESSIKIKRNKKWGDSLRSYQIVLDGEHAGIIFENQSISIAIEPGHHSLRMKLDSSGSEEINFDINRGEGIRFECKNNCSSPIQLLLILYYAYFKTDRWILLKQCK
jgi:hypothetical protein